MMTEKRGEAGSVINDRGFLWSIVSPGKIRLERQMESTVIHRKEFGGWMRFPLAFPCFIGYASQWRINKGIMNRQRGDQGLYLLRKRSSCLSCVIHDPALGTDMRGQYDDLLSCRVK